ncbi:MAG: aminotransferase class V-fold PLP-dependent enzyme [Planctomycetes bacterium]|nr:aminotransferase class V-fold PLP-dependent enzyme [Planctomycetota bacterium]
MTTRRDFLGALALPALAPGLRSTSRPRELPAPDGTPDEVARDEDFWTAVAAEFDVDRSIVNFNNGGVSPAPRPVTAALARHLQAANEAPAYVMWRHQAPNREAVRAKLARFLNVDAEELAFTRNASESLEICQFGIDLARGDEIVCCDQDYPRMLTTFRQRVAREGLVLNLLRIPVPCEEPQKIVDAYRERITERTKLILCSHVINLTGQVVPVKEITALGRERGIPVIVDGAHAFANLEFDLRELDCDYYATSLHKWLFAPIGTGLLFVKRDKILPTWPLMACDTKQDADIRKFEEIGTHPAGYALSVSDALSFHERLGPARKAARLRYLRERWVTPLARHPRFKLNTSLKPGLSNSLCNFAIEGVDSTALAAHLFEKHRIFVVAIGHADCTGIRVSPSVYTSLEEIDRFRDALDAVAANGLPG